MKTNELFEQYKSDDTDVKWGLEFTLRSSQLSYEELLDVAKQLIHEGGGEVDDLSLSKHSVKKRSGAFAYNMLGVDSYYPLEKVNRGKAHIMKKGRRMSRSPKAPWYLVYVRVIETETTFDGRISKTAGELEWGPSKPYHR